MYNEKLIETLIEQIAEIRALQAINCYMHQTLLESVGCDGQAMVEVVDKLNCKLADIYETQMRKGCGLDPRPEPRIPILPKIEEMEFMKSAPWNTMREH